MDLKTLPLIKNLVILFMFFTPVSLAQEDDSLKVTLRFAGKIPVIEAFNLLEKNYPVRFYYKEDWLAGDTLKTDFENLFMDDALKLILQGRPYSYRKLQGTGIVILPDEDVARQTGQLKNHADLGKPEQLYILVGRPEDFGKQKIVRLSGIITDGKTGLPVAGAVIQENTTRKGVISDIGGRYRMNLPPGLFTLTLSCVGYEQGQYQVKIMGDGNLDLVIVEKSIALDDVVVYGERLDRNVSSHQMSVVEINENFIRQMPSVAGSKDVLKALTIMPGVKSVGEFSSGINVRGGGEDQNLFLVNGAPLYNTSHVFGLLSVINPDNVEKLILYKGHMPASLGQRVSSVVDIQTSGTAPDRLRIKGGAGFFDSRLMAEVPLCKEKVFFTIGGRTSYSNIIMGMINDADLRNSKVSFHDINGTFHVALPRGKIILSGYNCFDLFRLSSEVKYAYGTTLGSLQWNFPIGRGMVSDFLLFYSGFKAVKDNIRPMMTQTRVGSGISSGGIRYSLKYMGLKQHTLTAGFMAEQYKTRPGEMSPINDKAIIPVTLEGEKAGEGAIFINDEFIPGMNFTVNTGIRLSAFNNYGEVVYTGIEPRMSVKIQVNGFSSFKISYNRNHQYLMLVSNTSVSTPSDIWKLSDSLRKPLESNHLALGFYRNFMNNSIETSVEVYYKSLVNTVECRDGSSPEMNVNINDDLIPATGKNYGIELSIRKNSGKIDGIISYSYSRALKRTSGQFVNDMINNNNWYPASFDRPHDFSAVINLHLNKRLQLSANFMYASGRPVTLPEYKYFSNGYYICLFSDKNKYRIPDYHRLDIVFSRDMSLRKSKQWKGRWSFSLLNVYGRKNPYTVYFRKEEPGQLNNFNQYSLYKLYLIGRPVPAISYSFVF